MQSYLLISSKVFLEKELLHSLSSEIHETQKTSMKIFYTYLTELIDSDLKALQT